MLQGLAYLGVTNAFAMPRLRPMSDREEDVEILALRHQIGVLERQLNGQQVRFHASDRAFLASLLQGLPPEVLRRMRLLVRPDTVLRWHRDPVARRHAARSRPKRGGRPCTVLTLSGTRLYVFAVLEHASRRIRVLGATAHPTASWVTQAAKNLVMDLEDTGCRARFLIRDRDGTFPALFDTILKDAGIDVVLTGVRIPRINALMERWVQTCRHELLDRTLIWNQHPLLHALREFEQHHNSHRPHQGIAGARPLHALPPLITDSEQLTHLDIRRRDHLGATLHAYRHAA
ncbi:integrase core domain-containing protein [Streptomyces incanus]